MATIGSKTEATFSDGSGSGGDVLNVDTTDGIVQIPNGKTLAFYSDAYTTITGQIKNGTLAPAISSTAAAIANAGTVATANVGIARLNPAAAVTGIIMAVGTFTGQQCWVVNEAVAAFTVTFDVAGTSNVADGVSDTIPGLSAKLYIWDGAKSLWYAQAQLINGTINFAQSATAAATAGSGTIATAGVGVARTSPASAITGVILAAGAFAGQTCLVVNEAVVANSVTFAASGTSNVANGVGEVIPGLSAKLYIWDSGTSLWYSVSPNLVLGTIATVQSATAVVTAGSGTIATAGIGVSRVNPAAAITGVILAAGAYQGQECWVVNEATAEKTATFDVSGTSNVANGVGEVIPGLQARKYVWNSAKSLWYSTASSFVGGTIALVQGGAGDPGQAGTFTTAGVGIVRSNPAAARTAMVMQAGTQPGQVCILVNESIAARSITFATDVTSNVADGLNITIYGLQARLFTWDSGTALWAAQESFFVNGTLATVVSATTPDPGGSGTIATAGVGVALTTPAAARTGIILGVGTINGQEVTVVNQGTAGNSLTMAASGTSNVADGTSDVISNFTAAKYVWNSTAALWYRVKAS